MRMMMKTRRIMLKVAQEKINLTVILVKLNQNMMRKRKVRNKIKSLTKTMNKS